MGDASTRETREPRETRELVLAARSRGAIGEAAFGELIRRYERTALALAYATLGGDVSAAGDVVQDAFLRAWQRLDELNEPDRFAAWLGRMVKNLAIDARRRTPRIEMRGDLSDVDRPSQSESASDPSRELDQRETQARIDQALTKLDEQTRTAVVLRYYENLSSKQIGEMLDLSPAAVDMRLSRARVELRERLRELVSRI